MHVIHTFYDDMNVCAVPKESLSFLSHHAYVRNICRFTSLTFLVKYWKSFQGIDDYNFGVLLFWMNIVQGYNQVASEPDPSIQSYIIVVQYVGDIPERHKVVVRAPSCHFYNGYTSRRRGGTLMALWRSFLSTMTAKSKFCPSGSLE